MDVSPSNGNLLALAGLDKTIKIFDKRKGKIAKTFEYIHSSKILQFKILFVVESTIHIF